jgi:hypothetical protein
VDKFLFTGIIAWEEKFRSKEATNNITNLHFLFSPPGTTNEKKKTKMMSRKTTVRVL